MSEHEVTLTRIPTRPGRCGSSSLPNPAAVTSVLGICRAAKTEELANRDCFEHAADLAAGTDDPQAFPMSSGQLGVWFTEQVMGVSAANNLCIGLRLGGALDTAAVELGLQIVVERHEILRTTFDVISGRPVQVVHRDSPQVLTTMDLRDAPEPERAAYAVARRVAYTPFDLKRGPVLRVSLLQLSAEQHILFCTLHHLVADGWSLGLFVKEIVECYTALCERRRPALKRLPLQYADCCLWEQDRLASRDFQLRLAHYANQLAGAPEPPHLAGAAGAGAGAEPSTEGASHAIRLSPELMSAMTSAAERQGTTVFALSLAAFMALLWQLSGEEDQVIGVPAARRNRLEFEDLIGPFANVVVVRTSLSGNPAFSDLLARTKRGVVEALAHEDVPFEQLVRALQPDPKHRQKPDFPNPVCLSSDGAYGALWRPHRGTLRRRGRSSAVRSRRYRGPGIAGHWLGARRISHRGFHGRADQQLAGSLHPFADRGRCATGDTDGPIRPPA